MEDRGKGREKVKGGNYRTARRYMFSPPTLKRENAASRIDVKNMLYILASRENVVSYVCYPALGISFRK